MIIDLTTQEKSRTSFNFLLQPDEINLEGEAIKLKAAVKIEANLTKGIVQTALQGEIFACVELECGRCLQAFENHLEIPVEAIFVTPEYFTEEKEAQLNLQDLEVSIFEGDKIDLREVARVLYFWQASNRLNQN